jgi:putative hemolysin
MPSDGLLLLLVIGAGGPRAPGAPIEVDIAVLLLLLCCAAFFSSSETALFSLQPLDRQMLRDAGGAGRLADTLRSEPRKLLATLLMGNEIANVTITAVATTLVLAFFPGKAWLTVVVVTPILLFFGEIVPKTLALRFSRSVARLNAWPLYAFYVVVSPIRWVFGHVAGVFTRLLGVRDAGRSVIQEEELRTLVDQGTAQGSIHPVEQEMIHAVFEFGDIPVSRVMTPRPDLVMLDLGAAWEEMLSTLRISSVSRIPVFVDDRDNVIGVLLAKDLLRFLGKPPPKPRQIQQVLHRVPFVPTTKRCDDLLDELRALKVHLALVVDEHGSIAGLVTLDDLLSELIGEVGDESDQGETEEIRQVETDYWLVRASVTLPDLEDRLALSLPQGAYQTLAGFILDEVGELPEVGRVVVWGDWSFEVAAVSHRRIEEVRIRKIPLPQPGTVVGGELGGNAETSAEAGAGSVAPDPEGDA